MPKAELISLVFELGFMVAIPIAVFAYLGRLADKALGTSPLFILAGILISIAITSFLVYKKITQIIKK